ncbi:MAG: hypothetical protein JWM80_1554 [Cyanobacteria bacterium RYN_339]|nr:hypothetical protein [Cyanobacteria bacterium RYN_339]
MVRKSLVGVVGALVATGCHAPPAATLTIGPVAPISMGAKVSGIRSLEISSGDTVSALDASTDRIELASLNTSGAVSLRITTDDGSAANVGGVDVPSGTWVPLPVTQLAKGTAVPVAVSGSAGPSHTFELATLPADFPEYTVQANQPKPGIVCFTATASDATHPSYLFITDQGGQPLYYKKLAAKGFDFQRCLAPDGSARYSYFQQDGPQVAGVSSPMGTVHLLDGKYQELKSLAVLAHGDHGALPADVHEFVYLDDDHYIVTACAAKTVTNVPSQAGAPSNVAAAIIQEVQGGQVVFEWDSTQYPEFYANASDGNEYTNATVPCADYMHLNSVYIDPNDGNLIVSFRHQDQVVKLDRKSGAILWRLGGKNGDFPLADAQKFSHQHFARQNADATLTLFDNGNALGASRLQSFKLDEAAKAVTAYDAFAPESRYSVAMGDVQKLDASTFFFGWGAHPAGVSDASEVTRAGVTTFSLTFADPVYSSYRALKYLTP